MAAGVRLKNEFTEDEKGNSFMTWLKQPFLFSWVFFFAMTFHKCLAEGQSYSGVFKGTVACLQIETISYVSFPLEYIIWTMIWTNLMQFINHRPPILFLCQTLLVTRLMRLWHLSHSVNSVFKHACAAIHWRYTSDILVRPFVYFHTLCVRMVKALARLRIRLSLRCSSMRWVP